jgi:HPt (histidine-containing phosphotransfer) domain-containing protein
VLFLMVGDYFSELTHMSDMTSRDDKPLPFDLEGLNQLYGSETVTELLTMSVDECRGLLEKIRTGISGKDSSVVLAAAHQMKGLASTMTINTLAEASLELETAARQERWNDIPLAEERLQEEFKQVESYILQVLGS